MRNSPVHAIRQSCRFSDRRGFRLPTVVPTGSGAEFSDRLSMSHGLPKPHWLAKPHELVNLPISVRVGAARILASGDRAVQGIDLSANLLIQQQLAGSDPKRQSGRDKHLGFP